MKIFFQREIKQAYQYAETGGQALHLCSVSFAGASAPRVFRTGDQFAHLFDQDLDRLVKTARVLGVRKIVPQHVGTERQHVDLCRGPLERAIDRANMAATNPAML